MTGSYDDIINLPHHVSTSHPHMSTLDRAAQFSPFSALTGYGAAVKETARLTDERIELDDNMKAKLDKKLRIVQDRIDDRQEISITYFQPDDKKDGGAYITTTGCVKKIDEYERVVVMVDGAKIPIEEIIEITGELFNDVDGFLV